MGFWKAQDEADWRKHGSCWEEPSYGISRLAIPPTDTIAYFASPANPDVRLLAISDSIPLGDGTAICTLIVQRKVNPNGGGEP